MRLFCGNIGHYFNYGRQMLVFIYTSTPQVSISYFDALIWRRGCWRTTINHAIFWGVENWFGFLTPCEGVVVKAYPLIGLFIDSSSFDLG